MATVGPYGSLLRDRWQDVDSLWRLTARNLQRSGFADVATLRDAIVVANPAVEHWDRIASGSTILVPTLPTGGVI